jgi:hypothetical protein
MITHEVPPALTTLSWTVRERQEAPWAWFGRKSYFAIDRELRRQAASFPAGPGSNARQTFTAVRTEFVHQVLGAIQLEAGRTKRWISTILSNPSRPAEEDRPPGPLQPTWVICVWRQSKNQKIGPVLLAEREFRSGPPPWGDARVAWFDPDQIDETYRALFREYFPEVLRLKPGRYWRTNRGDPVGWPLLTQYVVPRLYDYLRPYYPVRGYRRRGRSLEGHYPLQLRRDICDLVRLELPHLARGLTVARVTAAIQRHVATAPKDRPMGRAMFVVGRPDPEDPVT